GHLVGVLAVALAHGAGGRDGGPLHHPHELQKEVVAMHGSPASFSSISGGALAMFRDGAARPPLKPPSRAAALRAPSRSFVSRQLDAPRLVLADAEGVVGLHDLVDLAGAFVDHGSLAVPVEAAHRVLVGVAVPAVDLHGVRGRALAL